MLESIFRTVGKGEGGRETKALSQRPQALLASTLRSAPGFQEQGSFEDSENWVGVCFLSG